MASGTLSFRGASIKKTGGLNFITPDEAPGPWPVFYLLHGYSDDHTVWMRLTSIERYVQNLPLMVVMPDASHGWYTNAQAPGGMRYEDYLIKDIIGLVDRTFHTIPERRGRVIGGLSMGGYGAVKLALKHPDKFCSATSHSGAVLMGAKAANARERKEMSEFVHELHGIFGAKPMGGAEDCIALAKKCPRAKRPALRIDCGTEDFLLQDNRDYHRHLEQMKFPHEYAEFPGAHNWGYWDQHVQDAIAFHCRQLGL